MDDDHWLCATKNGLVWYQTKVFFFFWNQSVQLGHFHKKKKEFKGSNIIAIMHTKTATVCLI
jgi:hypothetical protein